MSESADAEEPDDPFGQIEDWDQTGYKVVAKIGSRYFSVWAGDRAEYVLQVPARETARPSHKGGLYVCPSIERATRHRIPPHRGGLYVAPRVLLRCHCEGPFVPYDGGKIACTAITPLEELPMPTGYLHSAPRRPSVRPLPARPLSAAALLPRPALRSADPIMRSETDALEAEVAALEQRLGYR
mmetsp:Transcript_23348/g.42915  ORF Transcript_23348/g.42915 Transcript_23348/m.42915 type:complete len:184 (-) Transcript_23348:111-662(-)